MDNSFLVAGQAGLATILKEMKNRDKHRVKISKNAYGK